MNETRHPRSRGCVVYAARIHRLGPTVAVIYACTRPSLPEADVNKCAHGTKEKMSEEADQIRVSESRMKCTRRPKEAAVATAKSLTTGIATSR